MKKWFLTAACAAVALGGGTMMMTMPAAAQPNECVKASWSYADAETGGAPRTSQAWLDAAHWYQDEHDCYGTNGGPY